MEDTRLPKCVMFGRLVGGAGCAGGQEKKWAEYFLDDVRAFGRDQRRPVDDCSPGRGKMAQNGRTRAEHFMAKRIAAEKAKAGLRHAVVCTNVTGRTKRVIAQSKQPRAS